MKTLYTFLLLLLLPQTAQAYTTFDVSCDNVQRMRIILVEAEPWHIQGHDYFHILDIELKPEARPEMLRIVKAMRETPNDEGEPRWNNGPPVTANGGVLQNDFPEMTGFHSQGITIATFSEGDAFRAARQICSPLVPKKVYIDGHIE